MSSDIVVALIEGGEGNEGWNAAEELRRGVEAEAERGWELKQREGTAAARQQSSTQQVSTHEQLLLVRLRLSIFALSSHRQAGKAEDSNRERRCGGEQQPLLHLSITASCSSCPSSLHPSRPFLSSPLPRAYLALWSAAWAAEWAAAQCRLPSASDDSAKNSGPRLARHSSIGTPHKARKETTTPTRQLRGTALHTHARARFQRLTNSRGRREQAGPKSSPLDRCTM